MLPASSLRPSAGLLVLLLFACGCEIEHAPNRAQRKAARQEKLAAEAAQNTAPAPLPTIDDAQLVLARCPQPASDHVLAIYNKLDNGPVRQMLFGGKRPVMIEFIPSSPRARRVVEAAPFAHPLQPLLPADTVWRFDEAHVGKEEILTSRRLEIYLPCAAAALSKEN